MSLETWKAEFYPVDAKDVSESDALAHSLKKWEGLRKENLERHGLRADGVFITDYVMAQSIPLSHDNCACCTHWYDDDAYNTFTCCHNCPLFITAGGLPCFGPGGAYVTQVADHNPEPMIQLIQLAIERQEKKS